DAVPVGLVPTQDAQSFTAKMSRLAHQRHGKCLRQIAVAHLIQAKQSEMHQRAQHAPARERQNQQEPWAEQQYQALAPARTRVTITHEHRERVAADQHAVEIEQHDARRRGLHPLFHRHAPANNRANSAAGSGARMNVSPTRNASTPTARRRATSSRVAIPLSVTSRRSRGTASFSDSVVSIVVSNVRKSRLLIPIKVRGGFVNISARCTSTGLWTSTSTSRPHSSASACRFTSAALSSAAAISRIASAPI